MCACHAKEVQGRGDCYLQLSRADITFRPSMGGCKRQAQCSQHTRCPCHFGYPAGCKPCPVNTVRARDFRSNSLSSVFPCGFFVASLEGVRRAPRRCAAACRRVEGEGEYAACRPYYQFPHVHRTGYCIGTLPRSPYGYVNKRDPAPG